MLDVTDIEIYRDGGTIEFRVSDSDADGSYRLQTPVLGCPEPLFKDERRLEFGSPEEVAVLGVLRQWQAAVSTNDVIAALAELDKLPIWLNLPAYLSDAVPVQYVRTVIQRLSERCI